MSAAAGPVHRRLRRLDSHLVDLAKPAPLSAASSTATATGGGTGGSRRRHPCDQESLPQRFHHDVDTVVLYRLDEGSGDVCHEASDPALTLRAHKRGLWVDVPDFGPVYRFERGCGDDANVLVGPVDHDALELRRCPNAYTVEAWVRYTGPWGAEVQREHPEREHPRTTAQICGTDEDGFSLPSGARNGWSFSLHNGTREQTLRGEPLDDRLMPQARNLNRGGHRDCGSLSGLNGTRGPFYCGLEDEMAVSRTGIEDEGWHHIAWQWRKQDEAHWLFVDEKIVWYGRAPETRVVDPNNTLGPGQPAGNTIPFMVGGVVHSQDPPFYLGWMSFEGEMAGLRISRVLRLPVASALRIVPTYGHVHLVERGGPATEEAVAAARRHPASLPDATIAVLYRATFAVEGGAAAASFALLDSHDQPVALPQGMELDPIQGIVHGVPTGQATTLAFTVVVTATNGQQARQPFTLCVVEGKLGTHTLPPAFGGNPYSVLLDSGTLRSSACWKAEGILPPWLSLESQERGWYLTGTPPVDSAGSTAQLTLIATSGAAADSVTLGLRVLAPGLRELTVDEHTKALWDWQGPDGKLIPNRAATASSSRANGGSNDGNGEAGGEEEGDGDSLTLSWVNMAGDTRELFPNAFAGCPARYPWECGGGEWGFATAAESGPVVDLQQCNQAWTVEAWVRVGDDQIKTDHYGREFDFGHICGSYDSTEQGVWELFLSTHDSPDADGEAGPLLAPGVTFQNNSHVWERMGPWKYPEGIIVAPAAVGADATTACAVTDTEWHHIAWQYEHSMDTHEIWLDGRLIWRLGCVDGVRLANNRVGHGAQFSVSTRLAGYSRYGGEFAFLRYGHWFGHIGDIRISDVRRLTLG